MSFFLIAFGYFSVAASDRHDFFFFGGAEVFNLLGFSVRESIEFVKRTLLFVLADLLVLLELIDGFLDVTADVANGGAVILQDFVELLDHILAALFGEA